MCSVHGCDGVARFAVYAAYVAGASEPHPMMARYPAAMAHLCEVCLPGVLAADAARPASTRAYVVEVVVWA